MKGRSQRCEGLVLALMDYGDSDRIGTFFTLEQGKLRALARSARTSRRRFGGLLELFARLQLELHLKPEGLSGLAGVDPVALHTGIRTSLPRIALAAYAAELCDRLLPDLLPNPRLYRLLASCLAYLDSTEPTATDRRFFEINLLNILGYRPPLEECRQCGAALDASSSPAFARLGEGLCCPACLPATGNRLGADTLLLLRRALQTGRFGQLACTPVQLAEAGGLLDAAIAPHLTRPLRSLPFLQEMGGAG